MTVTAHNKRRIYRGATKQPLDSESGSRFSYRDLYPYMYKDKPKPIRPQSEHVTAIREWILANQPDTAQVIAKALGRNSQTTYDALMRHSEMFEEVGKKRVARGMAKVWGVKNGV